MSWILFWLGGMVCVVAAFLGHLAYFVVVPRWAIARFERTHPGGLRRYLEWVAATPSLLGADFKFNIRSSLGSFHLRQAHHAEAEACYRANLAFLMSSRSRLAPLGHEADTRRRLADCLEARGAHAEAAEQHRRAAAAVDDDPETSLQLQTRGTLLERQNRHAEAYDAFEQALDFVPAADRRGQAECMVHLVLAAFNVGRPVDSLRWAEAVIAHDGSGAGQVAGARRMASVACGNLGRLPEAEDHSRRAVDLAVAEGDLKGAGEGLAFLGDLLRQQGKFDEALDASVRAEATSPAATRVALATRGEILRNQGRFDEALVTYRQILAQPGYVIPHHERRYRAAVALSMARIEADAGRGDAADRTLRGAEAELRSDAKLGLACRTTVARIAALRGRNDESAAIATAAEARLADFEQSPDTARGVFHDLALAASTRGDYRAGVAHWDRYLALNPPPVQRPTAHYSRGECHLALGDRAAAREDFRRAVAPGIDSHHARLAGVRLGEVPTG